MAVQGATPRRIIPTFGILCGEEILENYTQEQPGKEGHGKGFYRPVGNKSSDYRLGAFGCLYYLAEIYLHHYGIDHQEQ
jgi:hypothetical protein